MAGVAIPRSTEQISYEDLYRRWERGNWRATEIDFTQDRIDWHERFTPEQRRGALWLYSLFFHGEDSVADNLSPYIDAAPTEEQAYFLTTQQVDEARHAVFFRRFMQEVVGVGEGTTGAALKATMPELTWGHRRVFGRLDQMAAELRADRSPVQLAKAVTLYHIVIEASLAQPGQHIIERTLEDMDVLPGFREGMGNVALDEQRHIAFGVRLLADLYRDDPERIQDAIVSTIREVLPWTTATGWPPDRNYTECFGFAVEDIYEEGARAQEARLRAIGLPVDEIVPFPLPMDKTPRERAERGILLLSHGYIGEKSGPASKDPAVVSTFFDQVRRSADPTQVPHGTTIQWDFTDAPPWLLTVDGAGAQVEQRRASGKPTLTLKMAYQDFVDLSANRVDPRRLVLTGRLRPRGDLRMLLRLPRLFP